MIRSRYLLFLFPLFLPLVASAQQFGATNAQVITQAIEFFEVRVANPSTAKTEAVQPLVIYNSADPGPAKKSPTFLSVSPLLSGADGGKLAMTATLRTQADSGVTPQQYQINVTDPHGNIVVAPTSFPAGIAGTDATLAITIDPLLHPGPWKMGIVSGDTLIHQIDVHDASGDCPSCGSASCRTEVNLGCAETTIPVGPVLCGLGRVSLTWFDSSINGTFPGRANLRLKAAPDGVVVENAGALISKVSVYPTLDTTGTPAWVATVAGTGTSFTVTVKNGPGTGAQILRIVTITQSQDGVTLQETTSPNSDDGSGGDPPLTSIFTSNLITGGSGVTTGVVTLSERNGLRTIADTIWDDGSDRTETRIVREKNAAAGMPAVSAVKTTYHYYSWGREVVKEEILASETASRGLATERTYCETPGAGLGKLASLTRFDGWTEAHTYSGTVHTIVTPFADQANGLTKTITTSGNTRTEEDKVGGTTIAKTVTSFGESSSTRTVFASTTDTLATVTTYGTREAGSIVGGRPVREDRPDGTAVVHQYAALTVASPDLNHTVLDGSFTGTTLASGSSVQEIRNSAGELISRFATRTQASVTITTELRTADTTTTPADRFGRYAQYTLATSAGNVTLSYSYGCCGPLSESDIHGITTYRAVDDLDRTRKVNRLGVTTETTYDGLTVTTRRYAETYDANTFATSFSTDTDNIISRQSRNLAGTSSTSESPDPSAVDEDGAGIPGALTTVTTSTGYSGSITTTAVTVGTNTQTTTAYSDGRTYQSIGTLQLNMTNAYSVNDTGLSTTSAYLDTDGITAREPTTTQSDWAGRTTNVTKGTSQSTDNAYFTGADPAGARHRLSSTTDADGVTILYNYNTLGERTITALNLGDPGHLTVASIDYGTDQITRTETFPAVLTGGVEALSTETRVWLDGDTDGSEDGGTLMAYTERTPDGLHTWSWQLGVGTTATDATAGANGSWSETTTRPDNTYTITSYVAGLPDTTVDYDSNHNAISSITYTTRDAVKRPTVITDSRTGSTTTTYLSITCDAVQSVTDPGLRETIFSYDNQGRRTKVDAPNTTAGDNDTYTSYNPNGTVLSVSGAQYPVDYTYDYALRMKTMTTHSSTTASATTTWKYYPDTGLLKEKLDNSGSGPLYTYTPAGRLKTRTWARGRTTVYGYEHGRLTTIGYFGTDGLWNAYQVTLDLLAALRAQTDPVATPEEIAAAEAASAAAYAANAAGPDPATPSLTYVLDTLGRTQSITQANQSRITYTYAADLGIDTETIEYDLNRNGSFTDAADFKRVLARHGRSFGRDTGWDLKKGTVVENQATYTYDSAGRISTADNGYDTFTYGYQYNQASATAPRIGSVFGAKQDLMPYTVTRSDYPAIQSIRTYEGTRDVLAAIENRTSEGKVSEYDYLVNEVGQRSQVATSGTAFEGVAAAWTWHYDGLGQAKEAIDTSNFHFNHRAYQFDTIGNRVRTANGTLTLPVDPNYTSNSLNQYSAIGSLSPVYDPDGNAKAYPLPAYPSANGSLAWDGENRQVSATVNAVTTSYLYDALSRHIATTTGTGVNAVTTLLVYDRFNCIAEYSGATTLAKTYLWGLDISGTLQGAGGVGGLLAVNQDPGGDCYPTYDGNGNVSEYINEDDLVLAHFEYDPFGNDITPNDSAGYLHNAFAYRFGTKPLDFLTGLYYYGYRWYDPLTGRWISRDPIGEDGGVNLYGIVGNDLITQVDILGLDKAIVYIVRADKAIQIDDKNPTKSQAFKAITKAMASMQKLLDSCDKQCCPEKVWVIGWFDFSNRPSSPPEGSYNRNVPASMSFAWRQLAAYHHKTLTIVFTQGPQIVFPDAYGVLLTGDPIHMTDALGHPAIAGALTTPGTGIFMNLDSLGKHPNDFAHESGHLGKYRNDRPDLNPIEDTTPTEHSPDPTNIMYYQSNDGSNAHIDCEWCKNMRKLAKWNINAP